MSSSAFDEEDALLLPFFLAAFAVVLLKNLVEGRAGFVNGA